MSLMTQTPDTTTPAPAGPFTFNVWRRDPGMIWEPFYSGLAIDDRGEPIETPWTATELYVVLMGFVQTDDGDEWYATLTDPTGAVVVESDSLTAATTDEFWEWLDDLFDSETTDYIGPATAEQAAASMEAVNGHIYIDADGAVAPASSWAAQQLGRRKVYVG